MPLQGIVKGERHSVALRKHDRCGQRIALLRGYVFHCNIDKHVLYCLWIYSNDQLAFVRCLMNGHIHLQDEFYISYRNHQLSFCRAGHFRYRRGFLAILLRIQKGGRAIEMSGLVIRQETVY
jgi:hypothetical protein